MTINNLILKKPIYFQKKEKIEISENKKKNIINEIESIFLNMVIQEIKKPLFEKNFLDNTQTDIYSKIYNEEIAKNISTIGIGISDIIEKNIKINN